MSEPIPFSPEPFDRLQGRYPQALEVCHDFDRGPSEEEMRPEYRRRHLFDHEDGVRLMIHRGRTAERGEAITLSASPGIGTQLWKDIVTAREKLPPDNVRRILQAFATQAYSDFQKLSGIDHDIQFECFVDGVPYWYVPLEEGHAAG